LDGCETTAPEGDPVTFDDPMDRFLATAMGRSLAIRLAVAALAAVIAVM
jgi:hypothetical protein